MAFSRRFRAQYRRRAPRVWHRGSIRAGRAIGVGLWALLLVASVAAQSAWIAAGPSALDDPALSGRPVAGPVAALVAAANGTVYAAGPGGVWAYQRQTQSWTAVSDGAPVSALTIAGGEMYAGGGEVVLQGTTLAGDGIKVSADGEHWSLVAGGQLAGLAVTRIVANASGNLQWAATVAAPNSPAAPKPGLYAFDGTGWALEIPGNVWDVVCDRNFNTLAVTSSGIAYKPAGAFGFSQITAEAGRGVAALNPAGGFYVLWQAKTGLASLLAISADGLTVTSIGLPPGFTSDSSDLALAASGSDLWIGGMEVGSSSDQGQNWAPLTRADEVGTNQHAILPMPDGTLWIGNDLGVWSETVAGGDWSDENAGLTNFALQAFTLSSSGALAGLAGAGIAIGALGSPAAWTLVGPEGAPVLLAGAGAFQYAVAAGANRIEISSNGGTSWTPGGGLMNGANVPNPNITAVAALGTTVWIGGSDGELEVSTDGGSNFQSLTPPPGVDVVTALAAASAKSSLLLWLASGPSVWSSSDGGATWSEMTSPGGTVNAMAIAATAPGLVAAATRTGIVVWVSSQNAWQPLAEGLPTAPVTALRIDAQQKLWVATLGRGVWSASLMGVGLSVLLSAQPTAQAAAGSNLAMVVKVSTFQQPVSGATVTFSVSADGQSEPAPAAVTTGADGTAQVASYPLPSKAGPLTILATAVADSATASGTASINVVPAAASSLRLLDGGGQAMVNGSVMDFTLEVDDKFGNPVPDQTLSFSGSGGFSPASVTTGKDGRASVAYTLPTIAGTTAQTYSLTANDISASAPVQYQWSQIALPTPGYTLTVAKVAPVSPDRQNVNLTVQITPVGGYSQPVTLACIPACTLAMVAVTPPYPPVTAVIGVPASASESSLTVTITGDSQHQVITQIPLQGFTLGASAPSLNVSAAGAGPPLGIAVSPLNGFSAPVALQASGLPSGWEAKFNPTPIFIQADGGRSELTLIPSAAGMADTARQDRNGHWGWMLAALVLPGLAGFGQRRRRPRRNRIGWIGLGLVGLVLSGCGGGGAAAVAPAPPPPIVTSYEAQITAISGRLQMSIPISISVETP